MPRKSGWIQPIIRGIPLVGAASVMLADGPAAFAVMEQSECRHIETLREYNDQAGQGAPRTVRSAVGEKD